MALVTDYEETIIRKEDHLTRVTTAMFDKVTPAERDANKLKDFTAIDDELGKYFAYIFGLKYILKKNVFISMLFLCHPTAAEPTGDIDTSEYKAVNAPVVVKKKDPKARRKIREQRELKQALVLKKLEKKKITDLHR